MPARPLMQALAVMFVLAATVRPARADDCAGPLKLQFDAATAKWEVTNTEPACKDLVEMDINSKPTAYVGKSMQVQVTIIHVNPLLYSARFGEITLESISIEKDLASLFLSVGAFIQTLLKPPP